ncbi:MAG: cardiolipin synthase [Gammaproteobacteria bacterium]|nr:cardiolipin synthase [Gammaproteobacteria bacterium]
MNFKPSIFRRYANGWTVIIFIALFAQYLFLNVACTASLPYFNSAWFGGANARTVHFEDGKGPLSREQSAEIYNNLSRFGETTILSRHMALEQAVVGSPLVVGNKVTLLQDGPATYKAMFAAIRKAKHHINMETYIFEDDEIGRQFADLLIAKKSHGVEVNLIYDSVGAINTPRAFFDRLKANGIRVLEFNPVNPLAVKKEWLINNRDHRKLLIIDGGTAFLGGINISGVYSSGSLANKKHKKAQAAKQPAKWRDTHVQIDGPVVAEFQKLFLATWKKQNGEPLMQGKYFPSIKQKGTEVVRAVGSAADESYSMIYVTLLSAVINAENFVHLTNAYFVPDPQLLQVLEDAARRGVDVKLILPSRTDSWAVFHAGRSYYTELLRAGVKIYERRDAVLHAKTALIDGVWSSVGSTNLDWRSFLHNDEVNAVVLGPEFAEQMQAMFVQDLHESDAIELDRWRHRSFMLRVEERFARLWQYWL